MEGTPPAVLHLLHYAKALSDSQLFRSSALVYSACATSPSVSPLVQTRLLYNAARDLYLHLVHNPSSGTSPRDRCRALQFLSKCTLLLKSLPHSPQLFFKVNALTLSLHLNSCDYHAAQKTIQLGLRHAASRKGDMRWWAFLQSRLMYTELLLANHSLHGLHRVVAIATDTAVEMRRHSNHLGACAFALARVQYLLSAPCPDYAAINAGLKAALKSLQTAGGSSPAADVKFLDLVRCLLRAVLIVRRGDSDEDYVIKRLKNAYNHVCHSQQKGESLGWQWATPKMIATLTRHIVAVVYRGRKGPGGSERAVDVSLTAFDIVSGEGDTVVDNSERVAEVPEGAHSAFVVSLLESAARQRLMSLDFSHVKGYVGKMVEIVFPDKKEQRLLAKIEAGLDIDLITLMRGNLGPNDLRLRSCVMLLCAEYHNLLGKVVDAQIAGKLLSAVLSTATGANPVGDEFVSDAWQKALSLQLMLTGEPRPLPIARTVTMEERQGADSQSLGVDVRFGNARILAMAWFNTGVYQMRKGDILQGREAIKRALELTGPSPNSSDQILSNAKVVASALSMNDGQVDSDGEHLIRDAVASASTLGDLVTLSRALRQLKKWEQRRSFNASPAARSRFEADSELTEGRCRDCFFELKQRQTDATAQLIDEPPR